MTMVVLIPLYLPSGSLIASWNLYATYSLPYFVQMGDLYLRRISWYIYQVSHHPAFNVRVSSRAPLMMQFHLFVFHLLCFHGDLNFLCNQLFMVHPSCLNCLMHENEWLVTMCIGWFKQIWCGDYRSHNCSSWLSSRISVTL
jgi:hypothetical protein